MLTMSCGERKKHRRRPPLPERGWIQFLLLILINEKPMHGYQLNEELEKRELVKKGRFKTGSLYTILHRMEKKRVLQSHHEESEKGRPRRVYEVTERGRTRLKQGLRHMLKRKRLLDELEEYYEKHFPGDHGDGE